MLGRSSAMTDLGLLVALALAAGSGCKRDDASAATGQKAAPVKPAQAEACSGSKLEGALPWFHDTYDQARACAKARGVPLVIDMWAPWCHTCLSMQEYVLSDPSLAPMAERFAFVALDTDREVNAAVVGKFPVASWPTFFVVSPEDEAVQARFVGAATLDQWRELLVTGEKGHLATHAAEVAPGTPLALLRDAERAVVAGDLAAADTAYTAALAGAPAGWARRADTLVSLIQTRYKRGEIAGCLELGLTRAGDTGASSSTTDFLAFALRCAEERASAEPERARQLRELAVTRLTALADDAAAPLSVDDRSDALANLRGALDALGRKPEARAIAERQRALLDQAVTAAPSPLAAMTYIWPQSEVYAYLGVPLELVPRLEKAHADLPTEYDPPYRLAWIYLQADQPDQALPWAEKALGLVYGPRKARAQSMLIDIQKARGDRAAEKKARQDLIAIYERLPAGMAQPAALAAARTALAAMDAPADAGAAK
jgi:thioredoxin-like negative regulator of GroEL